MIRRIPVSLAIILFLLCYTAAAQQNTPETAPSTPSPVRAETSDLVVAKVSGEPITEKQVASKIAQMSVNAPIVRDQEQRSTMIFNDALDSLITETLLRNEARLQNVTVEKAAIDQQMQQLVKRFPSPEEFRKALTKQGITEAGLRKDVEEKMALQQVLNQAVKDVPDPTDAEIQEFYDKNPDKFIRPEQVHAAHILLRVNAKSTLEQKAGIKKKLEGIRAEIESNKISFAEAAAKYSQDPTNAKKGGDLGFFSREQMVKPFGDAAFSTKPGTLSPIVETQFGYHIIQVIELRPAGKSTIDEAKPAIEQYLEQLARQKAARKYIADLKSKATIENFMTAGEFSKRHRMP